MDDVIPSPDDIVLIPHSEEAYAGDLRHRGDGPVLHRSHYWRQMVRGFFMPVPLLTRLEPDKVAPPGLHWGFRAVLRDDAAASATGTLPLHLLRDVANYDRECLSRRRKRELDKSYRSVRFLALKDPSLLAAQGHRVVLSSLARTRHQAPPTEEAYLNSIRGFDFRPHRLVLAGMVGDSLGGYLIGHAVNETAYVDEIFISTEALATNIATGLTYEFVQACRRSGRIHEVAHSLHVREDAGLTEYKEAIGFPVVHLPTKVHINPIARAVLRMRYPDKLYRLEGLAQGEERIPVHAAPQVPHGCPDVGRSN